MKKTLLSVLASALLAISMTATAGVVVTETVGATSNYVDRGVSLSGKEVSASAAVKATLDNGVFGQVQTSTVEINGANKETRATVGYGTVVNGVTLVGGYTDRFYTGNGSQSNFGEVFGKASARGFDVFAAQTLNHGDRVGSNGYVRAGYTIPLAYGVVGNVGSSFTRYSREDKIRYTSTDFNVTYPILTNTNLVAGYSLGGHGERGVRLANQFTTGVSIGF
jgi:hypothetical protein